MFGDGVNLEVTDFNPRPRAEGGMLPGVGRVIHYDFNPRPRAEGGFR